MRNKVKLTTWRTKDGKVRTIRLYGVWRSMHSRCKNPNLKQWKYYGAKGIRVVDGWNDFQSFREWAIGNGYRRGLSIDRIDGRGNYSPENCRWADRYVQNNNRDLAAIRGEEHGRSKLTADAVIEIRSSDEAGITLAKRFDVCSQTITDIRNGTTWRHIQLTT